MIRPSIRTFTPECTSIRSPRVAILPSTLTRFSAIIASISRREPCPARASTFCNFSPSTVDWRDALATLALGVDLMSELTALLRSLRSKCGCFPACFSRSCLTGF